MRSRKFLIALAALAALNACDARTSPTRPDVPASGLQSLSSAASGVGKNVVCHYDKELDAYLRIEVSTNSLAAHFAHGDRVAGTGGFDEQCELIECRYNLFLNCPPSGDPQSYIDGQVVQINGAHSHPAAPCESVRRIDWDWGDGTVVQYFDQGPFPAQHSYTSGGAYLVTVTIYDATPIALDQATCDLTLGD